MAIYRNREHDERLPEHIWGKRIYKLLDEKGWTQNDLAKKSNVPAPTISGWISSKDNKSRSEPKISGFFKVAKALGVSTDYLLGEHECKTPKRETIYKTTGLSDKSLVKLHKLRTKYKNNNISAVMKISVLNYLIENIDNTSLFENLYNYLFSDYFVPSKDGQELNGAIKLISKVNGEKRKNIAFTSIIGEAYLGNIQSDLVRLKDKLRKEKNNKAKFEYQKWEKENEQELRKELWEFIDKKESEEIQK